MKTQPKSCPTIGQERVSFRSTIFGALLLAVGLACSRPAEITVQPYDESSSSLKEAVTINDGAPLTNNPTISLRFAKQYAQEMYITLVPGCETGGQWESYSTSKPLTLSGPDELKTIFVKFRNQSTGESPCLSTSVTLDTHPPTIALPTKPASITQAKDVEFSITATDNLAGVSSLECRFNSEPFAACPASIKRTDFKDGEQVFHVRSTDRAGNASSVTEFKWLIDSLAPTLNITSAPGVLSRDTMATFAFSATDDGGQLTNFQCQVDASTSAACTSPVAYSGLAQGEHVFKMTVTDRAGNRIDKTYTWQVDSLPPAVNFTTQPAVLSRVDDVLLAFNTTDTNGSGGNGSGVNGFTCQLDGSAPAACTSPMSFSDLADGSHTFTVTAMDRAGNTGTSAATFFIDDTPPTLTFTKVPRAMSNQLPAAFAFTPGDPNGANGSGVDSIMCKIDTGAASRCSSNSPSFSNLVDGPHTATFTVFDRAGNSLQRIHSWVLDSVAPSAPVLTAKPAVSTMDQTATFTYTSSDNTGGSGFDRYECKRDNLAAATCGASMSYSGLAPGPHSFQVTAIDKAGNRSITTRYDWTVESSTPSP